MSDAWLAMAGVPANAVGELLEEIGGILLADVLQRFVDQESADGEPWPARYPQDVAPGVNVAGILTDLNEGRTPEVSRFLSRPALVDTGALRNALTYDVSLAPPGVTVRLQGEPAEYASVLHHGGRHDAIPIEQETREAARRWMRGVDLEPEQRQRLRAVLKQASYAAESPARPFMGISPAARDQIAAAIVRRLERESVDG